jgi:polysaccharide export outer membrane protein
MFGLIRCILRALALAVLLAGCAATTTQANLKVDVEVLDALTRYEVAYVLEAGDQVEVFVYRQPDLSRKAIVRSDGFISLPLLGDVKAARLAPRELAANITDLYSVRLKNPEVTVIVENPPEPAVYVVGEVGVPKVVTLRQAKTVAQALAQSGIVNHGAELFSVSIVRLNDKGFLEAIDVKTENHSQPEVYMSLQNMALHANDLVIVPESYRGQVVRALTDVNTLIAPYFQYRVLQALP